MYVGHWTQDMKPLNFQPKWLQPPLLYIQAR
ncbi:hypothetical protein F9K99_08750 [Brucella anthropi]|nr:hypothetical protein F9K99_08750 [Brucella anthropi]